MVEIIQNDELLVFPEETFERDIFEYNNKEQCLVFIDNVIYDEVTTADFINPENDITDKQSTMTLEELLSKSIVYIKKKNKNDIEVVLDLYKTHLNKDMNYFELNELKR